MYPIFEQAMEKLYLNGMIDDGHFDPDGSIDLVEFTDTGRDMFEKGRVKQDPRRFATDVYYTPYSLKSDQYYQFSVQTTSQDGFDGGRFCGISFDPSDLADFIARNKERIGASDDDEVLSVHLDSEPELLCTDKALRIQFDEVSGDFVFDTTMDPNFVKGFFSAGDILLPGSLLPGRSGSVSCAEPFDAPADWEASRFTLVPEFSFSGSIRVFDPSRCECRVDDAYPVEGTGYDLVDIVSIDACRGYIFARKAVSVSGLEGSVDAVVLQSRPLDKNEVSRIIGSLISSIDIADAGSVAGLLGTSGDAMPEGSAEELVMSHLEYTSDIAASVEILKRSAGLRFRLEDVLEKALMNRGFSPDAVAEVFAAVGLKGDFEIICRRFEGDADSRLHAADALLPVSRMPGAITASLGLRDEICRRIMDGGISGFSSKELRTAGDVSGAFFDLKRLFGVVSLTERGKSDFQESDVDAAIRSFDTLSKGMRSIDRIIDGAPAYKELDSYCDLFLDLVDVYCRELPLDKQVGWKFGIGVRRRLEDILRKAGYSGDIHTMIDSAYEKGAVDEPMRDILHEMRRYGNSCAHGEPELELDSGRRKEWAGLLDDLERQLNGISAKRSGSMASKGEGPRGKRRDGSR